MAEQPSSIEGNSRYCAQCGASLEPGSRFCSNCGASTSQSPPFDLPEPQGQSYPQQAPNYLVQAILVTIFCCLPFGIVSVVFAAQVNGKLAAGDYAGAVDSSNKAKTFAWISFGLGLAVLFLWIIVGVFTAIMGVSY